MDIQVGKFSRYKNSFGEITLYFGPDYVSISSEEFRRKGEGPSAHDIRFSYGVHPKTCPALWALACAIDGEAYTEMILPFDEDNLNILRKSDYSEEHIVIMALDHGLLQLNLNGTYDHGAKGCIRNGGCFPSIAIRESESPEVFKALRGLMGALAKDNKSRPYPTGWSMQ